jgi:outer membrane protein
MSVSGNEVKKQAFRPLLPDVRFLQHNSIEDLSQISTKTAGVQTSDSFGIGVFGRCYFLNIGEHFTTYSQLAITSNSDKAADTKTLNANIGLGANYFITKKLSLVLSVADLVSYASVKAGNASAVNTTTVGFSGVTNPFATPTFGLNYRF